MHFPTLSFFKATSLKFWRVCTQSFVWCTAAKHITLKVTVSIFNFASSENKNAVRYGYGPRRSCRAHALNLSWHVLWPASLKALTQEVFYVQTCSLVMLGSRVIYSSSGGRKEMYVIAERVDAHVLLSHSVPPQLLCFILADPLLLFSVTILLDLFSANRLNGALSYVQQTHSVHSHTMPFRFG